MKATKVAEAARAGQSEIAHVGQRFRELQTDVVDVKALLQSRATSESLQALKALMSDEGKAYVALAEGRLRSEFTSAHREQQERIEKELAEISASASQAKLNRDLESRLTSLDLKVARKIDAAQEYSRLQEEAGKEGPTSLRLQSIQRAISQLQDLLVRIDMKQEPGTPLSSFSPSRPTRNTQSQEDLARQLQLASI